LRCSHTACRTGMALANATFFNCRFSRAMAAGSSVASCPRRTISTMAPSALASTATCGRNPSCVQ